jgi:hypothetical protein
VLHAVRIRPRLRPAKTKGPELGPYCSIGGERVRQKYIQEGPL